MRINQLIWESFRIPMQADFRFDTDDPLIVTLTFRPKDKPPVTWRIGRQLLAGDVQVRPVRLNRRWMVRIRLETRGRTALFEADLRCVEDWLHDTFGAVPMGEELDGVDWDAVVDDLLGRS
ncbi:SsgA family sporulation/cell division regulator [Streptomyces chiangmaiensis]